MTHFEAVIISSLTSILVTSLICFCGFYLHSRYRKNMLVVHEPEAAEMSANSNMPAMAVIRQVTPDKRQREVCQDLDDLEDIEEIADLDSASRIAPREKLSNPQDEVYQQSARANKREDKRNRNLSRFIDKMNAHE